MDDGGKVETAMAPPFGAVADQAATAGSVEDLFLTDYRRLVALARLLLDRQAEAEEVVQEAFARVLGARRPPTAPAARAYVERTVINLCRDGLRRRAVIRRVRPPRGEQARAAEVVALGTAEQQRVVAAVRGLPRRQRECVALRHLLDRSTAEAAATLGISEGSVKTHLSRGLAALETELEDWR
jgi:RNA polymerase sigma factor (sigma-70 family)